MSRRRIVKEYDFPGVTRFSGSAQPIGNYVAVGDTAPASATSSATSANGSSLTDLVESDNAKMAGAAAMAYHGYKRSSGSLLWTAFYAFMGHWKPQYAVPVAVAQGFGKRLVCRTEE